MLLNRYICKELLFVLSFWINVIPINFYFPWLQKPVNPFGAESQWLSTVVTTCKVHVAIVVCPTGSTLYFNAAYLYTPVFNLHLIFSLMPFCCLHSIMPTLFHYLIWEFHFWFWWWWSSSILLVQHIHFHCEYKHRLGIWMWMWPQTHRQTFLYVN
jgi:hypothetical protein